MRYLFLFLFSFIYCLAGVIAGTKDFHMRASFASVKNKVVYLMYSNGQNFVVQDSIIIDKNGQMDVYLEKIPQGLYTLAVPLTGGKNLVKDIVFDQDTLIMFKADSLNELHFTHSKDNIVFYKIALHLGSLQNRINKLTQKLSEAKERQSQTKYRDSVTLLQRWIQKDLAAFKKQYPHHIFTLINTLLGENLYPQRPLVTTQDTIEYRRYLKDHFLNISAWTDERLIRVKLIYDNLNNYLNNIVEKNTDSIILYSDRLMNVVYENNRELFQYLAYFLYMKFVHYMPFVGSDAVFYHMYTKYIVGDQSESAKATVIGIRLKSFGQMLMHNQIGMIAPNFELENWVTKQNINFNDIQGADYYLLCFWDPHCRHCRVAIPALDSLFFKSGLAENNNIKIMGITLDSDQGLQQFITENVLSPGWLHLYDTRQIRDMNLVKGIKDFRISYGILQTPTFYILDAKKKILAKNMGYKQILAMFESLRRKK